MRESNKVWQPSESRIAEANITQFIEHINRQGFDLKNYADLHQWSLDHNEQFWQEVWLFVQLESQDELDDELVGSIKAQLKSACSPRHVPSAIFAISDIPKTRSGKLVELAVKQVVNGRQVENLGAIANPEILQEIQTAISA